MRLKTKHFGEIEIEEKGIIMFEEGMPGFEYIRKFVLLGSQEDSPFRWLQSVDYPEIAFVVISPFNVDKDYSIEVNDEELNKLGIESLSDMELYSIVVVPEDVSKMTANLKAPVIINIKDKKGKQIILETEKYSVRHYVLAQN